MLRTVNHPATERAATESIHPFPNPEDEAVNRARAYRAHLSAVADNAAFGERLRQSVALQAATQNGHDTGYRVGWRAGWVTGVAWGGVCGVIATLLCGGMIVMAINLIIGRVPGVFGVVA